MRGTIRAGHELTNIVHASNAFIWFLG